MCYVLSMFAQCGSVYTIITFSSRNVIEAASYLLIGTRNELRTMQLVRRLSVAPRVEQLKTMTQKNPETPIEPDLDAYRFYERDWDDYEELCEAFEWEVPDQFNMATYLCDRWTDADPNRTALIAVDDDTDTTFTYGQLRRYVNQLANYFASEGIERGDRIAVSGAQKIECIVAHLATWKLGAVSVPLSLLFGPDGLDYRLNDSDVTAFVADGASLPALREIKRDCEDLDTIITVGEDSTEGNEVPFWRVLEQRTAEFESVSTAADEPAITMYTSGTTGSPKGVVHAHRSLLGILPLHVTTLRNMDLQEDDVLYTPGEWSWVGPFYGFVLAGLYYGTTIVGDSDPQFDPERTLELVDRYDVTSIAAPTTVYRVLMQVPDVDERFNLSSLRVVFEGGEALGQTVVDWIDDIIEDVAVHEGYGQTEAGVFIGDCEALGIDHEPGYMGKPAPGSDVQVVEPNTSKPVDSDEVGEIALAYERNPGCFIEYRNKPEETARKIQDGWLLTEDLGSCAPAGYVSFHSRVDDVIISSGYRIGPAEIEESLATHEVVADAGVIGIPDETRGEVPKAFVVLGGKHEPSDELTETLKGHVKERLAKHEYPRDIEFVDELPKTSTGKVRRHDLRKREGVVEAS